jgi:alkylated DNA repair dioxygenase AlkB
MVTACIDVVPRVGRVSRERYSSIPWTQVEAVPGFSHLLQVLTYEQQKDLVRSIDDEEAPWETDYTLLRQYYGYRYQSENDTVSQIGDGKLPQWLLHWGQFICAHDWMSTRAQQVTIQKYFAHSLICAHRDSPRCFGPEIVSISLVSSCGFCLTHARDRRRLSRRLEPGDVFVLNGDARFVWRHEIPEQCLVGGDGVDWRRLSVTFRTINPGRVR